MRRFSVLLAVICLATIVSVSGLAHAQAIRPVSAWGYNNAGQINVPSPNSDFYTISAGYQHSLGLKGDSTIVAWGDNYNGQCSVPAPNSGWIAVAAGWYHSVGVRSDGTIAGWGVNAFGQCDVPEPNEGFVAVAAGRNHSLGLKSDSTIVVWGSNDYGQCTVPEPNAGFIAIAAGDYHCVALKSDSTIVAWGYNGNNQCNVPSPNVDFVKIGAGYQHSLGLKSDSVVVAWGRNVFGQCNVPSPNESFVQVVGGGNNSLGLKADGTIVGWGYNAYGQCDAPAPNAGFVSIAAGSLHSLAIRGLPICSVSPDAIDFGTVLVADYKDTTFVLKNIGYETLNGSVGETCDNFSIISGEDPYSLVPGDSIIVTVRFEPGAEGPLACEIETGAAECSVSCSGTGQGPICSANPLSLDFGFVTIGSTRDLVFSLTNVGGGTLAGSVSEICEYFSIVEGEGAYALDHGDSLFVTVRFEPLTTDAALCTLSTGAECSDVICSGTGDRVPRIYAVRDVPGDQGGFINVAWDAAPGDDPTSHAIARYTVWRAIEATAAELSALGPEMFIARISDLAPDETKSVVRPAFGASQMLYWRLISSIDAYCIGGYAEIVPTLFDSTEACTEYHYVQIIAHSADPYVFWVSPPDSGRSVDNLAPAAPLGLAGEQSYVPEGITLTWERNDESDLGHYAVYRGSTGDFVPGPHNLIASPLDTVFFDDEWRWHAGYYYKVSALDVHGNEGKTALLRPDDIAGEEVYDAPKATYLAHNFPNPFNPTTKIVFGLSVPGHVSLRIYEASGRLVRELVNENRPAARYEEVWDGRDGAQRPVASGMYFYRLDAGSFTKTRKMILLR